MLRNGETTILRALDEYRREHHKPAVPRKFWRYLCELGRVREYESLGRTAIEDLSDEVDIYLGSKSQPDIPVTQSDWEFLASAGVDAARANTSELVVAFRKAHLASGLLNQREVAPWLSALEEREKGGGTFTVELPVRREWLREGSLPCIKDLKKILARLPANQPVGGRNEVLSFGVPDHRYPVFVLVADNGTTGELKRVAAALTATYGWQEGVAVGFILTGAVPLPAIARFTADVSSTSRRISISVDARCAPERLAKEFAKVRNRVLGVPEHGRYKPITSEKSMHLALFGLAQKEGTWAKRLRLWHAEHPDWHYSDISTFRRDVLRVLDRLKVPRPEGPTPRQHISERVYPPDSPSRAPLSVRPPPG
jgi:hypothetical protein